MVNKNYRKKINAVVFGVPAAVLAFGLQLVIPSKTLPAVKTTPAIRNKDHVPWR